MVDPNPFFAPSDLPYGLPPFATITDAHFLPAFIGGMREQMAEIKLITEQADRPSFENTMLPLERSGQTLERVSAVFFNRCSADSSDFTEEFEAKLAPMLATHSDAISLDPALYRRIAAIHDRLAVLGLDAESCYLVERYFIEFTLAGAGLDEPSKAKLRQYNQQLATLTTRFERNLLADSNNGAVIFDTVTELDGLTAGEISAAAAAAEQRGLPGKYLVTLVLPTGHPYLG